MSLSKFVKIQEIVQKEAKEVSLERKSLGTNQMKKKLDKRAEWIRLRVQKHIKYNNIK